MYVSPALFDYAPDVQLKAAEELAKLPPSCPRSHAQFDCSAVKRMMGDYGLIREQMRSVEKAGWLE